MKNLTPTISPPLFLHVISVTMAIVLTLHFLVSAAF